MEGECEKVCTHLCRPSLPCLCAPFDPVCLAAFVLGRQCLPLNDLVKGQVKAHSVVCFDVPEVKCVSAVSGPCF